MKLFITKLFSLLCGVAIVTLGGCANINKTTPYLLPSQNYLIVETAIDTSLENARLKALSLLSQNIFVTIKSNFYSLEKLTNNSFNTISSNEISSDSIGFFKDITFSAPIEIKKNKYKISVGLTSQALINTINYLNSTLKFSLIDNLTQTDLITEYNKTIFLLALVLYAQNNNISLNNIDNVKITSYKENLSLRLSDASQLKFNVLPNTIKSAMINILNKDHSANDSIFVPNGTYYYTVHAQGYKPLTKKLEITSKDKFNIDVYLQKLLNKPIPVYLDLVFYDNNLKQSISPTQFKNLLEKYQLQINNFVNSSIKIHFSPATWSELNSYYYFNLPITISLVKNNTVKLMKAFNIPSVSKNKEVILSPNIILEKLDNFLAEVTQGNTLAECFLNK